MRFLPDAVSFLGRRMAMLRISAPEVAIGLPVTNRPMGEAEPRKIGSRALKKGNGGGKFLRGFSKGVIGLQGFLFLLTAVFPGLAWAQKEVTSPLSRYGNREAVSRYYERYEAKPRAHLPFLEEPLPRKALITLAPTAEPVRIRKHLADSHSGLLFYESRTCTDCHADQARDLHKTRANITCRQCHGGEPIAGISHYYSPMNPRRRYAFVCAKCHEGSNASFATYRVHAPNPVRANTLRSFPVLFYVFWGMIAIAVGTFLVFLPHAAVWGIREFLVKKDMKKEKIAGESDRKIED